MSTNATGLQIRLTCARASSLLLAARPEACTSAGMWLWPQGCSIRQGATKFGARSCDGLKKAPLPRQALVMLVENGVPPIVPMPVVPVTVGVVSALQAADVGIWFVSVKKVPNGPAKFGLGFSAATATDTP